MSNLLWSKRDVFSRLTFVKETQGIFSLTQDGDIGTGSVWMTDDEAKSLAKFILEYLGE